MTQDSSPGSLTEWLDPARAALVLIDMQVDFASPEGLIGQAGVDMTSADKAVARATELAIAARKARVPLIFVRLETRPETDSTAWLQWMERQGRSRAEAGICRAGTRGADFVGPQPDDSDTVIVKHKYSGFYQTQMDEALRARGVDTLVLCGLTTECCIDCTARDAFHHDYHVFIASDACAAYDQAIHDAAINALTLNCAIPLTTGDVVTAWQSHQDNRKTNGKVLHV